LPGKEESRNIIMAFDNVGQEPGLEIWRIEDFEAVPYDKANYGKFHVGDSYIVLKVCEGFLFCQNARNGINRLVTFITLVFRQ
jgi:hypothetical protein